MRLSYVCVVSFRLTGYVFFLQKKQTMRTICWVFWLPCELFSVFCNFNSFFITNHFPIIYKYNYFSLKQSVFKVWHYNIPSVSYFMENKYVLNNTKLTMSQSLCLRTSLKLVLLMSLGRFQVSVSIYLILMGVF